MTDETSRPVRLLLLGGTSEAAALAERLAAARGVAATLSLAGRTAKPLPSALPVRVGGFGGVAGLSEYLKRESIDLVVDATHPFAAEISGNAIAASEATGIPLIAVERPAWAKVEGDDWQEHATVEEAIAALPEVPQTIFSGLGRQAIAALRLAPQHHYVIRVVDPMTAPPELPHATIIAARGPFRTEDDAGLFRALGIARVLAKNSGGSAAYAKIEAARRLGLPVHMMRRPIIAKRPLVTSVEEAMAAIAVHIAAHQTSRAERGV